MMIKQNKLKNKMIKKKYSLGFSLIEIMLVLGVATGLLLLAFMLNKGRQESVVVEDARRQLTKIVSSLEPIKNTLNSFAQVIPTTGLTNGQKKVLLSKELLESDGALRSSFGEVDVRSLKINNESDAYAISYKESTANFCAQLVSKTYDQFYQVRVGATVELNDPSTIVWTSGETFDPSILTQMCTGLTGERVVQFISAPLKPYNGIAQSSLTNNGSAIAPIALSQALVSAGAVTAAQSLPAIAGPVTTIGQLDVGAAYNPNDVEAGAGIVPPGPNGTCNAASFTWGGGCSGTVPGGTVNSGSSVVVGNSASGYIGGLQVACNNGTWEQSTATCFPAGCASTGKSWGGGCSGNLPNARSGNSATINSTTTYSGSASYSCYLGSWTAGSATCAPPTPPDPDPGPSGVCGYSHTQTLGSAPSVGLCSSGSATGVATGATTYTWSCLGSNGGTNQSCWAAKTAAPGAVNCPAANGPVSWGNNVCGANVNQPPSAVGTTVTLNNTRANATGQVTYLCNGSGNWQVANETCSTVVAQSSCNVSDQVASVSFSGTTGAQPWEPPKWVVVSGRLSGGSGTLAAVSAPRNMPGGAPKVAWCPGATVDSNSVNNLFGNVIWYPGTNTYGGTRNNQAEFQRAFTASILWNYQGMLVAGGTFIIDRFRNFAIYQDGSFYFEYSGYDFQGGG